LLLGACTGTACWAVSGSALATSARPIAVRELLQRSRHALLATPTNIQTRWETAYGTRRIVTYTRLLVSQALDGRTVNESEMLVRTLGGKVGHIGQVVHGEARLQLDKSSALFLDLDAEQVWRVTAMAQGHYPLRADATGLDRLVRSPDLPELRLDAAAAVHLLPGRTVLEAERLLAEQR
jgi:hypothetical protein